MNVPSFFPFSFFGHRFGQLTHACQGDAQAGAGGDMIRLKLKLLAGIARPPPPAGLALEPYPRAHITPQHRGHWLAIFADKPAPLPQPWHLLHLILAGRSTSGSNEFAARVSGQALHSESEAT
jgi:hypothetical protein